jgi:hypothetical protein
MSEKIPFYKEDVEPTCKGIFTKETRPFRDKVNWWLVGAMAAGILVLNHAVQERLKRPFSNYSFTPEFPMVAVAQQDLPITLLNKDLPETKPFNKEDANRSFRILRNYIKTFDEMDRISTLSFTAASNTFSLRRSGDRDIYSHSLTGNRFSNGQGDIVINDIFQDRRKLEIIYSINSKGIFKAMNSPADMATSVFVKLAENQLREKPKEWVPIVKFTPDDKPQTTKLFGINGQIEYELIPEFGIIKITDTLP